MFDLIIYSMVRSSTRNSLPGFQNMVVLSLEIGYFAEKIVQNRGKLLDTGRGMRFM